jgi:hypothetical protein
VRDWPALCRTYLMPRGRGTIKILIDIGETAPNLSTSAISLPPPVSTGTGVSARRRGHYRTRRTQSAYDEIMMWFELSPELFLIEPHSLCEVLLVFFTRWKVNLALSIPRGYRVLRRVFCLNEPSFDRMHYKASRRYWLGVTPITCLNTRENCDWLVNPQESAISTILRKRFFIND